MTFFSSFFFNHKRRPKDFRITKQLGGIVKSQNQGLCLDAGCGTGAYFKVFNDSVLVGLDVTVDYIDQIKQNPTDALLIVSSIEYIPFRKHLFTTILCSDVLEYFSYNQRYKIIVSLLSLLRNNGHVIISVPNSDYILNRFRSHFYTERNAHDQKDYYMKMGGMISLDELLSYGFEIHGCMGWVTRSVLKYSILADVYDLIVWNLPYLSGTVIGILKLTCSNDQQNLSIK